MIQKLGIFLMQYCKIPLLYTFHQKEFISYTFAKRTCQGLYSKFLSGGAIFGSVIFVKLFFVLIYFYFCKKVGGVEGG